MTLPIPPSAIQWLNLFSVFFIIGLAAGSFVVALMVYYSYRYRSRNGGTKSKVDSTLFRTRAREAIILASLSAILLLSLAVVSVRITTDIHNYPSLSESLLIDVTAFQWNFKFTYPNNVTTVGECRIPTGKPIVFNVTSSDVMHNFGLPDFRLKIDAIPGRYNTVWIEIPSLEGNTNATYQIRCYELCGIGHTYMIASLVVMQPADFNLWLSTAANKTGG